MKSYDYSKPGYYFVTICTHERKCLFGEVMGSGMVLNESGRLVEKIWNELPGRYPGVEFDCFVIMPNHLHGILKLNVGAGHRARPVSGQARGPAPTFSLSDVIQRFKSFTTAIFRERSRLNGLNPRPLCQRNYYDHVIRRDESLENIRKYILENPLKWALDENHPENLKRGR